MRLRPSIRAPQRLDSDLLYLPLSQKPLRVSTITSSPSYIEYNPNLPPAAFPTLEKPRAPEPEDHGQLKLEHNHLTNGVKRTYSGTSTRDSCVKNGNCKDASVDFEDIPIHMIENYTASNGDLNPIYRDNMTKMAAAGRDSPLLGEEMEDSDQEEAMERKITEDSFPLMRNPSWKDLSEQMQVEIFGNLLDKYSWPTVCHMLGLTATERKAIQELSRHRIKQIQLEDSQLEAMRRKQLRGLLRIDNSSRNSNRNPPQFVYRKIFRQSVRRLNNITNPDYLICEANELRIATKYLHKRGIDQGFAGEWSSSSITQVPGQEDGEWDESLAAELDATATPSSRDGRSTGSMNNSGSSLSTPTKVGRSSVGTDPNPKDPERCRNVSSASLQLLTRRYNESRENNLVARLKIGAERAARIQGDESPCIQPTDLSSKSSSRDEPRMSHGHGSQSGNSLDTEPPLRRVPVESLLYPPAPPNQAPRTIFSSMGSQDGLAEGRREAWRERQRVAYPEGSLYDSFSEPEEITMQMNSSPPTTPGRVLSPTSSEIDPFGFSTIDSARSTSTVEIPYPLNAPRETVSPSMIPPLSECHGGFAGPSIEAVPVPDQSSHTKNEDYDDDDEVDLLYDEMVLLPSS